MSEFEDKLNELLNDPGQMERIAGIAKSLMGGEAPPEPAPDTGPDDKAITAEKFRSFRQNQALSDLKTGERLDV